MFGSFFARALVVAFAVQCFADDKAELRDHPIIGDDVIYLDGTWELSSSSAGIKISGAVPGDLLTDLQNAALIEDPLYELTFLGPGNNTTPLWDASQWQYSLTFDYENADGTTLLVFDGVKMGATIELNGKVLGQVTDQFLRYQYDVTGLLYNSGNILTVTFDTSGSPLNQEGRWMACTGGWDWAPYSNTYAPNGAFTFSKGIWKSVYLVPISSVAITYITPLVYYNGPYPTSPLTDTSNGPWTVSVRVFFWSPSSFSGTLSVTGGWGASANTPVSLAAGNNSVTVNLTANNIKLWWPNGFATRATYPVDVTFTPSNSPAVLSGARTIGFRVFVLVTDDDTVPSRIAGVDGSGNLTMRFKVNGANIWSRGGNMIPTEELEGRLSAATYDYLLQSAAAANFNTLRVWGGGIYYPDVFYDLADAYGLLLYHDLMYAQQGHSPAVTPTQEAEIRHQVRRLASHPSLAVWDGCNECGGEGIYASFGMATVVQEDDSRPPWPSCPSNGWLSGVDRLWGLPNHKASGLSPVTYDGRIETHGPYQHGGGFPAMNGVTALTAFNPNIPASLGPTQPLGVRYAGVYASEFGCSVFSSFESMSATLSADHFGIHGGAQPDSCTSVFQNTCNGTNVMAQRNYPCDNIILTYFGVLPWTNATGTSFFQRQLYLCMLGQALEMKSDIESRRSQNEFGTVTWQLNEIWPTGGWGSVEYGTVNYTSGQVLGGRWKPLHYFMKARLYRDVAVVCGEDGRCIVKNDNPLAGLRSNVTINVVNYASGKQTRVAVLNVTLPAGASSAAFVCLDGSSPASSCPNMADVLQTLGCAPTGEDCGFSAAVQDAASKAILADNFFLATIPGRLELPSSASVSVEFGVPSSSGNVIGAPSSNVSITLTSNATAMFIHLTTLAQGVFSDNSFHLFGASSTTVTFSAYGPLDLGLLKSSLRVEHLAEVLNDA